MENGSAATANGGTGAPYSAPTTPVDTDSKSNGGHKRSLSGSILARLPFLRSSEEISPLSQRTEMQESCDAEPLDEGTPKRSGAMANAMRQTKGRKRKGSLRKTAILGTGKFRVEGRERRNSLVDGQKRAEP